MEKLLGVLNKYGLQRDVENQTHTIEKEVEKLIEKVEKGIAKGGEIKSALVLIAIGLGGESFVVDGRKLIDSFNKEEIDFMKNLVGAEILHPDILGQEALIEFYYDTRDIKTILEEKIKEIEEGKKDDKKTKLRMLFDKEKAIQEMEEEMQSDLMKAIGMLNEAYHLDTLTDELYEVISFVHSDAF